MASRRWSLISARTRSSLAASSGYGISLSPLRGLSALLVLPRRFQSLDQLPHRGMQRGTDAGAFRFARDGAAQIIHLSRQFVVHVVQHGRGMVGLRPDLVHLPWILVQADAASMRDALAFVDERVEQGAEGMGRALVGKFGRVRQPRERRDSIH